MEIKFNDEGLVDIKNLPVEVLTVLLGMFETWEEQLAMAVLTGLETRDKAEIIHEWMTKHFFQKGFDFLTENIEVVRDKNRKCHCPLCDYTENAFEDIAPEDIIGNKSDQS